MTIGDLMRKLQELADQQELGRLAEVYVFVRSNLPTGMLTIDRVVLDKDDDEPSVFIYVK